jgi:hypothetical protein
MVETFNNLLLISQTERSSYPHGSLAGVIEKAATKSSRKIMVLTVK